MQIISYNKCIKQPVIGGMKMGIIKAFAGATGGTMADQWLEMYCCDSIPQGILALRGQKQVSERSSNTKGDPNIISDGSVVVV